MTTPDYLIKIKYFELRDITSKFKDSKMIFGHLNRVQKTLKFRRNLWFYSTYSADSISQYILRKLLVLLPCK